MMNHGKITTEMILAIRGCKTAHPKWGATAVSRELGLDNVCTRTAIGKVMYNQIHVDPDYKPVPPGEAPCGNSKPNAKAWSECRAIHELKAKRKPSIDCVCLCPTCGMGYDTMHEAMKCCEQTKRMKEA